MTEPDTYIPRDDESEAKHLAEISGVGESLYYDDAVLKNLDPDDFGLR